MISLLIRGVMRVVFHLSRLALAPVEVVRPRIYMRIYAGLLGRFGVNFTGAPRYISSSVRFDRFDLVTLGEYSVISRNVILLTHDYSLSTALSAIGERPPADIALNREIQIGANVFIGMNAILLPGTTIEDNVIIAAGSVIRGNVGGDAIYAGNPAQRISGITDRAEEWRARSVGIFAAVDAT